MLGFLGVFSFVRACSNVFGCACACACHRVFSLCAFVRVMCLCVVCACLYVCVGVSAVCPRVSVRVYVCICMCIFCVCRPYTSFFLSQARWTTPVHTSLYAPRHRHRHHPFNPHDRRNKTTKHAKIKCARVYTPDLADKSNIRSATSACRGVAARADVLAPSADIAEALPQPPGPGMIEPPRKSPT